MNKKTLGNMNTSITAATDKVMEDLRLVMENAEELLHATASQSGEAAVTARARIQNNLSSVKHRLLAAEKDVIEQARHAAKSADQYVRDNPWQAIGIAAGAGVLIGILIARAK